VLEQLSVIKYYSPSDLYHTDVTLLPVLSLTQFLLLFYLLTKVVAVRREWCLLLIHQCCILLEMNT